MTLINQKTDTTDIIENWPYDFQRVRPQLHDTSTLTVSEDKDVTNTIKIKGGTNSGHYDYLSAYSSQLRYIDTFIDELHEQQFLDTATGRELEKLASEVSITRQSGENDTNLRYRALLGKAVAASDGTPKDIETIMEIAFGKDKLESVNVTHKSGAPVIQFELPSEYINDIPLTRAEFEDELESAFPASHGVEVVLSDTWLLGRSGSQGIGNGGLL